MFFRVRDQGIPVEQIELSEPVLHVSWEPSGDRLVVIHGEPRAQSVSFYSMSGTSSKAASVVAGKGNWRMMPFVFGKFYYSYHHS